MGKTKTRDEELEEMMGGSTPTGDPFEKDQPDYIADDVEDVYDITQEVTKPGMYHGKVIDAQKGTSSTGNPQWTLKIDFPQIGRSLDYYLTMSAKTQWKVGNGARALNVPMRTEHTPEGDKTFALLSRANLVGKLCLGEVENEEYQGTLRPKCKNILPPDAGTVKLFSEL